MPDIAKYLLDNIILIVLGLLASAPGVYSIIASKRKEQANYADKISQIAMKLVTPLEDRITDLEKDVRKMRRLVRIYNNYINILLAGIDKLLKQFAEHNIAPVWQPEELKTDGEDYDKI